MLQCSCKATDVRDHTAAHDEYRFVARYPVVFELNQYLFHVGDVFVDFVAVVHQLDALDAEVFELCIEFLTLVLDDLVTYDGHAAPEWLLQVGEEVVRGL